MRCSFHMTEITDEFMRQMISRTRNYCVVILKAGPNRNKARVEKTIWVHGRRNFALRAEGLLPLVCPVFDESNVSGVGIFNADIDEVKSIMNEDPAVKRRRLRLRDSCLQKFSWRLSAGAKYHAFISLSG